MFLFAVPEVFPTDSAVQEFFLIAVLKERVRPPHPAERGMMNKTGSPAFPPSLVFFNIIVGSKQVPRKTLEARFP